MDNHTSTSRAEAERLLGVAAKLLGNKDLNGSKEFAFLAQESEPLLEGSDQIVAIIEVLLAAEKRINNHPDYYSLLQIKPKSHDSELIKKQYRRLALLLHPDKNKFPFSESAFHLVADAWAVLSDPAKKSTFDNELGLNFSRVDLEESRRRNEKEMETMLNQFSTRDKFPASGDVSFSSPSKRRGRPKGSRGKKVKVSGNGLSGGAGRGSGSRPPPPSRGMNFWTGCPYCYTLYEYPKMYEGCCLRCENCNKAFTAEGVGYDPPMVPGKEEYYCCWGMFPMGFNDADKSGSGRGRGRGRPPKGFGNWMPGMQNGVQITVGSGGGGGGGGGGNVTPIGSGRGSGRGSGSGRGRGRPRKVVPTAVPTDVSIAAKPNNVAMEVPVALEVPAALETEMPVAAASVSIAPASVLVTPGSAAGSVSVTPGSAAAPVSVTPGSSSAPTKRGRGRPRKNPLP